MIEEIQNYMKEITPLIHSYITVGFPQVAIKSFIERGEKLSPIILSQFPPNETIPDSIPQCCFPWGTDVLSDSSQQVGGSSSQFNFIITNDDGSSLYCACAKTFLPVFEGSANVQRVKSRRMSIKTSDPLDLPSFDTCFATARNRNTISGISAGNSPRDTGSLFVPKCIVLISKAPILDTMFNILKELVKLSSIPLLLPLECYIAHLVLCIPYPPRGMRKIVYQLGSRIFNFAFPEYSQLPLLDTNLGKLLNCLDLKNVLIIFRQLATEQSVVFLSSNENNLTACSYILISFLFPFKWSLLYAPILPEKLIDYLYSPVAFVFGMNSKYRDSVYARCNGSVLIVDLDRNKIEMNLQAVKISQQTRISGDNNLPSLPIHYGDKLKKRLKSILKKHPIGPRYRLISDKLDEGSCEKIREFFFQFFVSILQNYNHYLNKNWTESTINSIFETRKFFNEYQEKNCKFIQRLTKTQMFANFCQSRVKPKNSEEDSEKLFFDDHIQAKLNRSKFRYVKKPTKFIDEAQQNRREEKNVIKLYNCYKSKGQVQYATYPDFSLEVLSNFGLPFPKCEQYTAIADQLVIHLAEPEIKCKSDEDFIFYCWIQIWAATLWYQHDAEHNLRLRELTKVLEMIDSQCKFSPARLYRHLLESCMTVNPSLALPIFSVMSRSSVLINIEIIKLLRQIIAKLFIASSGSNSDQSWLFTYSEGISPTVPVKNCKRIFVESKNSSKQEVSFLLQDFCRNCEKELTAEDIKKGWRNTGDEINCECGAEIKPNLRVKIQIETFGQNKFTTETVSFLNPRSIKGVTDELLSEGENKFHLDVETLRSLNGLVFWNLVWHFYKAGLPYEFIMPYENEVSPSNYININYDDAEFKTTDEKECQTEWDLSSVEEALKKYYEVVQESN
ncbi:hypothetical protein SteCoe_26645 [Stentor coeruleus]|uniref:UDENN domain-containing protein n=1 Tax=Stentor coeruleus TaxID=5963 RepID=A0A1R2BCD3_9CILI|nr:hypothetical protein SteCoe_26645 [Stentor coeruleus]